MLSVGRDFHTTMFTTASIKQNLFLYLSTTRLPAAFPIISIHFLIFSYPTSLHSYFTLIFSSSFLLSIHVSKSFRLILSRFPGHTSVALKLPLIHSLFRSIQSSHTLNVRLIIDMSNMCNMSVTFIFVSSFNAQHTYIIAATFYKISLSLLQHCFSPPHSTTSNSTSYVQHDSQAQPYSNTRIFLVSGFRILPIRSMCCGFRPAYYETRRRRLFVLGKCRNKLRNHDKLCLS